MRIIIQKWTADGFAVGSCRVADGHLAVAIRPDEHRAFSFSWWAGLEICVMAWVEVEDMEADGIAVCFAPHGRQARKLALVKARERDGAYNEQWQQRAIIAQSESPRASRA